MEETLVLIDEGFVGVVSKHLGKGKYLKFDKVKFSKRLAKKENLFCKHVYYYTAPPFQSEKPTEEESRRYKRYERFVRKLSSNPIITVREGRCQRLKIDGKFIFKQKAVDSLMIMDLMRVPIDYEDIKKIILIASDSDFVPIINYLKKLQIKTILYTCYEKRDRRSILSTSNELIKSVHKYVLLTKKDFDNAPLEEVK